MAKQVATTKETSGAGYGFEDKVAAHFSAWMLAGGSPFVPRLGHIVKIEFQKRVDNYFPDDLVITLDHAGHAWELCLSVKSNAQFGVATAPASFVKSIWEMFLHEGSQRFTRGRDLMGLVTAPLPDPPRTPLLADLLPKAHRQEPSTLVQRLTSDDPDSQDYVSAEVRKLFRSFACPEELQSKHGTTLFQTAELPKRPSAATQRIRE